MHKHGNLEGNSLLHTAVWLGPLVCDGLLENEAGAVHWNQ